MPYGLVVPDVPRGTFRAPVSLRNGALVTYPFVSPTPEGSRDPAAFRKRPPHACGAVTEAGHCLHELRGCAIRSAHGCSRRIGCETAEPPIQADLTQTSRLIQS